MRHYDTTELKKTWKKAQERYHQAKNKLANIDNVEMFSLAAQEANDAWLEFKKVENELHNCSILKKMGDLYGC